MRKFSFIQLAIAQPKPSPLQTAPTGAGIPSLCSFSLPASNAKFQSLGIVVRLSERSVKDVRNFLGTAVARSRLAARRVKARRSAAIVPRARAGRHRQPPSRLSRWNPPACPPSVVRNSVSSCGASSRGCLSYSAAIWIDSISPSSSASVCATIADRTGSSRRTRNQIA